MKDNIHLFKEKLYKTTHYILNHSKPTYGIIDRDLKLSIANCQLLHFEIFLIFLKFTEKEEKLCIISKEGLNSGKTEHLHSRKIK